MSETLETGELLRLIETVFRPGEGDRALAILVDLPDAGLPDHPEWASRRRMAADWQARLAAAGAAHVIERVDLVCYRNVRRNNADLPEVAYVCEAGAIPADAEGLDDAAALPFERVFATYRILLAPTELSATAPLKLNAARHGFRAATMPGFAAAMIPALRLDYDEIHRRCVALKQRLDRADGARIELEADAQRHTLYLDLRHRKGTASGGLVREVGTAGNLPSGETYIVPYEGERDADPSRTRGTLPIELDGELLVYRIEGNRVREVIGGGPVAERERAEVAAEPAYSNVAELGLGILADYGIHPTGQLLLDEKLGLHIAFGRSDHFGGTVGAADFSSPDKVVHIDRVYLPEVQPAVRVVAVDLERDDPAVDLEPLMRDGQYV